MTNQGKPEGRWAPGISKFLVQLLKKVMMFFLGLSFLSAIVVYVLLTAYPDEWDEVDPSLGLEQAEMICGPPINYGAWPEKSVRWEWGTKWIYWEFILYSGNHGSRTQVCFCKQVRFCKGCVDFKIDQSYEKGLIRGLKKTPSDIIRFLWN